MDYQSGRGMAELAEMDGKKKKAKPAAAQEPVVAPPAPSALPKWTWIAILAVGGVVGLAFLGVSLLRKKKEG